MDYALEKAKQVADEHGVAGVITFDEMFTPLTARIADALRVPGFGVDAVENCRDKIALPSGPSERRAHTACVRVRRYSF